MNNAGTKPSSTTNRAPAAEHGLIAGAAHALSQF